MCYLAHVFAPRPDDRAAPINRVCKPPLRGGFTDLQNVLQCFGEMVSTERRIPSRRLATPQSLKKQPTTLQLGNNSTSLRGDFPPLSRLNKGEQNYVAIVHQARLAW